MPSPCQNSFSRARRLRPGFTLVELLAGVGILVLLLALMVPTSSNMIQNSHASKCVGMLKNFAQAAELYSLDNDNKLLPAQTEWGNGGPATSKKAWHELLGSYLDAKPEHYQSKDPKFWCRALKKSAATPSIAWAWGYGYNSCPGYEGPGSTTAQKRFHWEELNMQPPQTWKGLFRKTEITHRSKRLWICDSAEWHVSPKSDGSVNHAQADRHGKDKCNVLFFDGHVESLNKAAMEKAVYNPGG
jgi:prepilin-type processing-associated H-X9-DG protein